MKEFLGYVVGQLVDRPEDIVLRSNVAGDDMQQFVLELPRSEVGKVIGKQGHTIRAIRNLLTAAAARHDGRVSFEIVESSDR